VSKGHKGRSELCKATLSTIARDYQERHKKRGVLQSGRLSQEIPPWMPSEHGRQLENMNKRCTRHILWTCLLRGGSVYRPFLPKAMRTQIAWFLLKT
jgi:hypothetical protein